MSINKVMITGNLTRDPDFNQTASGTQTLKLGVAVNDRFYNKQTGEWEDKPNFVDCVLFGKRAGSIEAYLHKGQKVAIAGKLSFSAWEDKQTGQKRSKLEVIIDDIEFLSAKQEPVQYIQPAPPVAQVAPQAVPQTVQQAPLAQTAPQSVPQTVQQAPAPQAPMAQATQPTAAAAPVPPPTQEALVYDKDIPF